MYYEPSGEIASTEAYMSGSAAHKHERVNGVVYIMAGSCIIPTNSRLNVGVCVKVMNGFHAGPTYAVTPI